MKLTRYTYHGPQSSVTLRIDDEELDVSLFPNSEVNLPSDHDYTQALLAQKLLTLQPTVVKTLKPDNKVSELKATKEVK